MIFLGILVSIVMFSIIVLIHEYGHYKTAKIFGIHVEEFGLGIPPRAKKLWKNKQGTLFSLNWIPLGGFVKIAGESEIFLTYYGEKGKILSHKGLEKKLKNHDDIFDKKGGKIKNQERKYIFARLSNQKTGANFYEKNIFAKSLVLLAGIIMNFLLAALIFSVFFFVGIKPVGINSFIPTDFPSKLIPTLEYSLESGFIAKSEGIILYPIEGSLAEKSGIIEGDVLTAIDGEEILDIETSQEIIKNSGNQTLSFTVSSAPCNDTGNCIAYTNKNIDITIGEDGLIGSYLSENLTINKSFEYKYGLIASIKEGFAETYYQTRLTFSGLKILLTHIIFPETPEERTQAIEQVAGPIGIVNVITQSLQGGFTLLIILGAIISINLGVFNLLPIPALDGGRLLLLWVRTAIDKVFGKTALSGNIENMVHVVFFLLLIALSILIAYNDIIKLL